MTFCQHCGQPIHIDKVPRPFSFGAWVDAWVHVTPAFPGRRQLCRVTYATPEETSTT